MKVLIKSREISLTKTELKMLTFFFFRIRNRFFQKHKYWKMCLIWKGILWMKIQSLFNIRRLREKIEDNPAAPVYIKNIRGLGYIWNQEVRQ